MPGPVKLSGLPYDNSPSIADYLVGIQNAGTTDSKFLMSDIVSLIAAQNLFSSAIKSSTNSGTGGGTLYYINLGGIKLCWGLTASQSSGSPGNVYTVVFPTSFFNAIQTAILTSANMTSIVGQQCNIENLDTSAMNIYFITTSASTQQVYWFVVGS